MRIPEIRDYQKAMLAVEQKLTALIEGDPQGIYTKLLTVQLSDAADELGLKLVPVDEAGGAEDREAA